MPDPLSCKPRKIIHIDMDCFYASIEMRENPTLADKPVAVGGRPEQRGVLTTCNYIARKFGLHSAMPTAQALKLCPHLVLLPVNMPLYCEVSRQIHQIFQRYTTIIEPLSLDEAYLDVTDCDKCAGSATWIAQDIRQAIWDELRLTGVGKVTSEKLLQMGLAYCADVQKIDRHLLLNALGKMGQQIWSYSHGIDERMIQPHRERKSIGVETTLLTNITALEQGIAVLDELYAQLVKRVQRSAVSIPFSQLRKIGVKLKFEDFQVTTLEKSAVVFSRENFQQLLSQIWQRRQGRSIRLIGLHVMLPEENHSGQMSLWGFSEEGDK